MSVGSSEVTSGYEYTCGGSYKNNIRAFLCVWTQDGNLWSTNAKLLVRNAPLIRKNIAGWDKKRHKWYNFLNKLETGENTVDELEEWCWWERIYSSLLKIVLTEWEVFMKSEHYTNFVLLVLLYMNVEVIFKIKLFNTKKRKVEGCK